MIQTSAISRETLRARLYALSVALDALVLLLGFTAANLIVLGTLVQHGKPHGLVMFAMIAPVYLLLAVNGGAYGIRMLGHSRSSAIRAIIALAEAAALMLLIVYLGRMSASLSRLTFTVGLSLSAGGLVLVRLGMERLSSRIFGEFPSLTAFIVDGLESSPPPGAILIDAPALGIDPARHDAAMAARLAAAVGAAEQVVVVCPTERMEDWSIALQSLSARGEILVPELARFAPAKLGSYEGYPTLIVAGGPMMFRDRIIKRIFDLFVGVFATLLLLPVLVAAAIAVKLSSRGPVFFRQQRLGRDARPFAIFKFRTMRIEASDHAADTLTQREDPRVTRVGAFLRRTSIDELPQLFNVLNGDMSIVGPRPHAAGAKAADKLYWEVDDRYWARHCIKPGMTGLAQVRGHRGTTHEHRDLVERLQSDLEYVTRWSIWRDIRIIVATAGVLFHPNAY